MIMQKNDESIEEVDRSTFMRYIESKDFLAVIFCKDYLSLSKTTSKTNIIFSFQLLKMTQTPQESCATSSW